MVWKHLMEPFRFPKIAQQPTTPRTQGKTGIPPNAPLYAPPGQGFPIPVTGY